MRPDAIEVPKRLRNRPRSEAGYVIPWFVYIDDDGREDFRVIGDGKIEQAVIRKQCWVCGQRMSGPTQVFVIGAMCAVNRVSAEPPSHYECAHYAAMVCPFLANPKKRRREGHKPPKTVDAAGVMIPRNPGVALLWISRRGHWKPIVPPDGRGVLFDVGKPVRVEWYCEGREANRAEVLHALETGLPILEESAKADRPGAMDVLAVQLDRAMHLVPAA